MRILIIGNGFDLQHGLKSNYCDFSAWLKDNDGASYQKLDRVLATQDHWSKIEEGLGDAEVFKEIISEVAFSQVDEDFEDDTYGSDRQYAIEYQLEDEILSTKNLNDLVIRWINEVQKQAVNKIFDFLNNYDLIINFNYTSILETSYEIPREKIVYIHGKADEGEIFFGHDVMDESLSIDSEVDHSPHHLNWLVNQYNKNVDENIKKIHNVLSSNTNTTIDIYGHSLGRNDKRYFELIPNKEMVRNFNIEFSKQFPWHNIDEFYLKNES